jgi:nicotinamidase/pyrazinamidase
MTTLFVDVDTQLDFVFPSGALYVPGAERVLPAIAQLNRYAASHAIPVLSTVDAHSENDPEFTAWPPHCVIGTTGQHKAAATQLEGQVVIPNRPGSVSVTGAQQIVLEKQTTDAFATQTIRAVLDALGAGQFVVYGVVAEICVLSAVRGLLERGGRVVVAADATRSLDHATAAKALDEIRARGGLIQPLSEVLATLG